MKSNFVKYNDVYYIYACMHIYIRNFVHEMKLKNIQQEKMNTETKSLHYLFQDILLIANEAARSRAGHA